MKNLKTRTYSANFRTALIKTIDYLLSYKISLENFSEGRMLHPESNVRIFLFTNNGKLIDRSLGCSLNELFVDEIKDVFVRIFIILECLFGSFSMGFHILQL